MSEDSAIQSVEISTIAHATEDISKVETAMQHLLANANRQYTRHYLTGHHGNPIIRVDTKLTHHDAVEFAKDLNQRLSGIDRDRLQRDLSLYSDEDGNLYIRLDKQSLFNNEIKLGDEDPIRVRMKFNRLVGDAEKLMMRYLES